MKYKLTNKIGSRVKIEGILFEPYETKVVDLKSKPDEGSFNIEELEKPEKKSLKGGK